jgi:fructose-bisphosphate aldolase, class I
MMHINGMSSISQTPDTKLVLTSMETACRLGADAISLQINFDGANDDHNLTVLGSAVDRAQRYGLPVLTMLYDKVQIQEDEAKIERLRHLLRIAIELGTDAIKIGSPEKLKHIPLILEHLAEDVAIYFAGGALSTDNSLYDLAALSVAYGAHGLCVGRNVFQRAEPGPVLSKLKSILLQAETFENSHPRTEDLEGVRHGIRTGR